MNTTLNKIRENEPCTDGWEKLLRTLGKTKADDEPLSLITVLDSNGLDDALWCLRAVDGYEKEMRLYAVWCARQVQYLMKDQRSIDALDVAERFAHGEATKDELAAARDDAESAARSAAWSATWSAAWSAVRDDAESAAWSAAWSTTWSAANAAWDAGRDAASAAGAARDVSSAARTAARSAARDAQEVKFREMFGVGDERERLSNEF